ncbi:MAG: DUF3291 domain-containing protein [Hyphomicrobiales bacterium]|nr:DUF3291 domain-containing protein [Hyphomicrobiales bacterium]
MHIAQINIARLRFPPDDPRVADFIDNIDAINALAERSEGFVWRFMEDGDNPSGTEVFGDPRLLVNMSIWESVEALQRFAYKTVHRRFVQRSAEWFRPLGGPHLALWWVPVGDIPDPIEGQRRLDHLETHGPSAYAFTFHDLFDPPIVGSGMAPSVSPSTIHG